MKSAEANRLYSEKLSRARRNANIESLVLEAALAYYLLFSLVTLWNFFTNGELTISNSVLLTLFPLAAGLGALIFWKTKSLGKILIFRTHRMLKNTLNLQINWLRSFAGWYGLGLIALTLVMGYVLTEMDPALLFSADGMAGARRIFISLLTPNTNILNIVINAMIVTIFIAFTATATAVPVAFVLSFLCSRNLMSFSRGAGFTYLFLRFIFNFTRSVEPIIWAIIFSVWVGIGPFAGMLALLLHSIASLAKLYSEQIESIDRGPLEAIEATGANRVQVIWYAVVPQVILPFLSYTIYRWDINIRMATVIGLVGGGGVGTLLMQYQGLAKWNEVGTIVITIAIVVWLMDFLSAKIREAIY